MKRYSLITKKMPREMLLLVGKGCFWKKCTFCDYYNDISDDAYSINKHELNKVTGETGVLDIINSGSCFELDAMTLIEILKVVQEKNIHTIWFESHWFYKKYFDILRKMFSGIELKFRLGIETFDDDLRNSLNKGFPKTLSAQEVAKDFDGVCLLVGIKGQTKDIIKKDLELANQYFDSFSVNIFNENSTAVEKDPELVDWFIKNIVPSLADNPKAEVLINNTDLGVGDCS